MYKICFDQNVQERVADIFAIHGVSSLGDPPNSGISTSDFFSVMKTATMLSRDVKYRVPEELVARCF